MIKQMQKTPYLFKVVQLSGTVPWTKIVSSWVRFSLEGKIPASFLTSLYGTDYRSLLEFFSRALYLGLYNSRST